jgi:hypothetical protein
VASMLPFALVAAAHPAAATPMTFKVIGPGDQPCRADCRAKIVAEGSIEAETPKAFLEALSEAPGGGSGAEVLVSSQGGDVHAAMELGAIFRRLRMRAAVARLEGEGVGRTKGGFCASACVYMVMGAVRRRTVAGSHVCLHRMSVLAVGPGGWARRGAAGDLVVEVSGYARRMGVSADLVNAAEAQEFDHVTPMSTHDMTRWRFLTAEAD